MTDRTFETLKGRETLTSPETYQGLQSAMRRLADFRELAGQEAGGVGLSARAWVPAPAR